MVWGTVMAHHGATRGPAWASNVLAVLSLLHLPLAIVVVYAMQGLRWFAVTVVLFELWIASVCSFIASMSVSNVWL